MTLFSCLTQSFPECVLVISLLIPLERTSHGRILPGVRHLFSGSLSSDRGVKIPSMVIVSVVLLEPVTGMLDGSWYQGGTPKVVRGDNLLIPTYGIHAALHIRTRTAMWSS